MLRPCGHQIDAGGFHAGMAQHVRKLDHIPAGLVKGPGKQMPQVVGEHLSRRHPGFPAKGFHFRPNLLPRKVFAASGAEYPAGNGFLRFGVPQQFPAELFGQQDGTDFSF